MLQDRGGKCQKTDKIQTGPIWFPSILQEASVVAANSLEKPLLIIAGMVKTPVTTFRDLYHHVGSASKQCDIPALQ